MENPNYKQLTVIISGTYNNIWTPAVTNNLELSAFDISSNVPQALRLIVSGTSIDTLVQFRIPASGTIIRSFVHPLIIGTSGVSIGIGTTVAGSVDVTIYGKEYIYNY